MLFAAAALFFIILGALINFRFTLRAALRENYLNLKFTLRFFYGLIPLNFFIRVEYQPRQGVRKLKILKSGGIKPIGDSKKHKSEERKELEKALLFSALSAAKFKKIETAGEIGFRSDAVLTALLTGAVKITLDTAIRLFIFNFTDSRSGAELRIGFFPCMTRDVFSLNLEGIAAVNMPKLIKKTVCVLRKLRIKRLYKPAEEFSVLQGKN